MKNMTGAIYVAGALDYETRKRVSHRFLLLLPNRPLFANPSCDKSLNPIETPDA